MVQPALKSLKMPEAARPRSLAERIETEVPRAAKPESTVSSMAERFAPDALRATRDAPRRPLAGDATLANGFHGARRFSLPARGVIAVLTAVAIAPAAILAGLLWFGAIHGPEATLGLGGRQAAPSQQAAVAGAPVLRAAPQAPDIALSAPEEIVAKAGEEVGFAIAVDAAEALPQRSVIAIRDIPEGAAFSEGRPYGANEWSLHPDEIAGLTLRLPEDQSGATDLRVELVAADGAVLARAATRLDVAPNSSVLVIRSDEADRVQDLMAHGHKMIAVGYFAGARAYFKRAAEAGSGEAALALGATYDPAFISGMGAHGIKPDFMTAKSWYDRAAALGVADHDTKLAGLKQDWGQAGEPSAEVAAAEPEEAPPAPAEPPSAAKDDERPGPLGRLVAAASELTSSEEWLQTVSPVNIRADPSSTAETRKIAQKGLKVRVLGREGNWVQVADPATKEEGWIYTRFLKPAD